jgi:hypothetical protein
MHARHFIAWGFVLGLLELILPACAVSVDSAARDEDEATADAQQEDEAPIDVTARFLCKGLDVVECMIRCADQGTPCRARRKHPKNTAAGGGDLYACRTSAPRSCDYQYANGDRCYFYQKPDFFLCRHNHG